VRFAPLAGGTHYSAMFQTLGTVHPPREDKEFSQSQSDVSAGLTFSRLMTCICRTAPLTSRRCILYIYSTNIRSEYFKHAAHSPFLPLQNAVYFIMLPFLVHVLFTF
jgi:hypothetical protein